MNGVSIDSVISVLSVGILHRIIKYFIKLKYLYRPVNILSYIKYNRLSDIWNGRIVIMYSIELT